MKINLAGQLVHALKVYGIDSEAKVAEFEGDFGVMCQDAEAAQAHVDYKNRLGRRPSGGTKRLVLKVKPIGDKGFFVY